MVGHHPTNKLIGREPIPHQNNQNRSNLSKPTHASRPEHPVLATLSCGYPEEGGRLLTCYSPVRHSSTPTTKEGASPFDLHVLSTPPAFVLSQDQTLHTKTQKAQNDSQKTTNPTEPATTNPHRHTTHTSQPQPSPTRASHKHINQHTIKHPNTTPTPHNNHTQQSSQKRGRKLVYHSFGALSKREPAEQPAGRTENAALPGRIPWISPRPGDR